MTHCLRCLDWNALYLLMCLLPFSFSKTSPILWLLESHFLKGPASRPHEARYSAKAARSVEECKHIPRVQSRSGCQWCLGRCWSWRPRRGGSDGPGTPCPAHTASRSPRSPGPCPHPASRGHRCKTVKRTLEICAVMRWDCSRNWALLPVFLRCTMPRTR